VSDPSQPRRESSATTDQGLDARGGARAGRSKSPPPAAASSKEARDTVAGCRDRAAQDRLQAASAGTDNGRRVFERSAASWEARADEMEEGENGSAEQLAADRDLWASEEPDDPASQD
jgi:hypothetical protein